MRLVDILYEQGSTKKDVRAVKKYFDSAVRIFSLYDCYLFKRPSLLELFFDGKNNTSSVGVSLASSSLLNSINVFGDQFVGVPSGSIAYADTAAAS